MRKILFSLACALPLLTVGQAAAQPVPRPPEPVLVVGVTEAVFRQFVAQRPSPVALGVYPPSRSPRAFMRAVDRPPCVRLQRPEKAVPAHAGAAVYDLFGGSTRPCAETDPIVRVHVASSARETLLIAAGYRTVWVLGFGDRTPVWIATTAGDPGILTGGEARRDGILTPADLSRALPPGRPLVGLSVDPVEQPLTRLTALRARLVRDASYGAGLTCVTVAFGLAGLAAFVVFRRGRRHLAEASARAAAMVPAGYLAGMFIPSASWVVRSVAVAIAFAIGWRARSGARPFVTRAVVGTAAVLALLTVAAAMRPNGEPALSLWGDPLVSWRFFGLRNHLAAFLAGGAIVGVALSRAEPKRYALVGIGAIVLTGAPMLGAQFIGVLTLTLGLVVAGLTLWRRRVEWWHPLAASAGALAVTVAVFLSDIADPISHGGRAAQLIRSDGLATAWEIFVHRARLNYRDTIGIPVPGAGVIGFVGVVGVLVWMLVRMYRAQDAPIDIRAAVLGGAWAALAALFVEDSGFFTGSILALYPALALCVWWLERSPPAHSG